MTSKELLEIAEILGLDRNNRKQRSHPFAMIKRKNDVKQLHTKALKKVIHPLMIFKRIHIYQEGRLRRTIEEQNVSTFGKRVTELRKEKNLTQKALGEIVGVTKNTVSTWERDLRMPEFETLNALCSFFGVNTAYLLGENVERKEDSGSSLDDETAALYVLDDLAEESEPYVKKLMQLSHEARLIIHASIDAAYKYERSIGELYRKTYVHP